MDTHPGDHHPAARPIAPVERRFRVSRPGLPDLDVALRIDGTRWTADAVPWAPGSAAGSSVSGDSADGLAALGLLAGLTFSSPAPAAARSPRPAVAPSGDPVVYFLGSHGLMHMLNLLGNSLQYCLGHGARLVPILELAENWRGVAFQDLFAARSEAIVSPEDHARLLEELPDRLDLPIAGYREIAYGFVSRADEDCLRFHGALSGHRLPGLPWGKALPPGSALLTGGAPWPPPGVPNGWIVAMQGIALNDRIRGFLAHRAAQLPPRFIGAHFRNTDSTSSLADVVRRVDEAARATDIADVVWATDDIDTLPEAQALLPHLRLRAASLIPAIRGAGARGLHFLTDEQLAAAGFDRLELVKAALLDLFALVRADVFVPTGEAVSGMETSWSGVVHHLRENHALAEGFFGLAVTGQSSVAPAVAPTPRPAVAPGLAAFSRLAALRNGQPDAPPAALDAALAWLRQGHYDPDSFDAFFAFAESVAPCSTAQMFQDLWALWESRGRTDGFFVEFGATDGRSLSNSYLLERGAGWRGIVAEPNPAFHAALERNRGCIISHACVWDRSGAAIPFIAVPDGSLGRLRDVVPDDGWEAGGHRTGKEILVPTVTLADLLTAGGAPRRIDYLSIDTEGSELDILAAFDFTAWDVRTITVEHNYTPLRDDLHALLTRVGYRRKWAEFSQWDDWYVKV